MAWSAWLPVKRQAPHPKPLSQPGVFCVVQASEMPGCMAGNAEREGGEPGPLAPREQLPQGAP